LPGVLFLGFIAFVILILFNDYRKTDQPERPNITVTTPQSSSGFHRIQTSSLIKIGRTYVTKENWVAGWSPEFLLTTLKARSADELETLINGITAYQMKSGVPVKVLDKVTKDGVEFVKIEYTNSPGWAWTFSKALKIHK